MPADENRARHVITAPDGGSLVYLETGPSKGEAVLLCHGLGAAGLQFAADGEFFAGCGYRVLIPDLRGHGASGLPPQTGPAAYAVDRLADDLLLVLDHAGADRVHWVGNSLGGIIGLTLAARAPERFRSLAIFGTALALNLPRATGALIGWIDRFPGRAIAARMTAATTTENRAARPLIAAMLRGYDAGAVAAIAGHISRYDLIAAAQGWTGPGLVLVGGKDQAVNRVLPRQLDALAGLENWRIRHLPLGGHCANLDAGPAWRREIEAFWAVGRTDQADDPGRART